MPFAFTTIKFVALMRAAAVALLSRVLMVPSAFPDSMNGDSAFTGPKNRQRTVTVALLIIWGLFDSKEAADQHDAFIDGFEDYVLDHRDQADPHSVIASVSWQDVPSFVPDWVPPDEQLVYYATRIALEGYVSA